MKKVDGKSGPFNTNSTVVPVALCRQSSDHISCTIYAVSTIYCLQLRPQLQIPMRDLKIIPHKVESIAPKERLLRLAIAHPEPRTPERSQLLDGALRRRLEIRLDPRRAGSGNDIPHFLLAEDLAQCNGELLRPGEVVVVFPEPVEDG